MMLRNELLATPSAQNGSRLYLLVDPTLDDPFPEQARRKVPLPIVHESLRDAHCPYLLRDHLQGKLFERSLQLARQEATRQRDDVSGARAICGWIFTHATPNAVATHLAHHARLPTPEGARLLRYWDPRVMDLMCRMLTAPQIHALTGPITAWYWAGRDAHLQTWQAPADAGRSQHSLGLTQEQQQVLAQAPHVNGALDVLQDAGHGMSSVDPLHLAHCVSHGRDTWCLTTAQDHISYALHCALVHERFDQLPDVHRAMTAQVAQGQSAMCALAHFDDAYWHQATHAASRTAPP